MSFREPGGILAGTALMLFALASTSVRAGEVALPAVEASAHYGAGVGTTTVPAVAFSYVGPATVEADGFAYISYSFPSTVATGSAAFPDLPNGAEVTQFCTVLTDEMWCGGVRADLYGWEYPAVTGGAKTPRVTLASAGTDYPAMPGTAVICSTPAVPIKVGSSGNLDGDADSGWTGFRLSVNLVAGPCGGLRSDQKAPTGLGFGAVVVHWRRTVSPAPATATFGDVGTAHPFFRFVEALAASGITGGCGGGQFCPDSAVTRGQMAVFLATALGLHHPN